MQEFRINLDLDMSEYGLVLLSSLNTPSRVEYGVHHNRVFVNSVSVWAQRSRRPFVMLRFRGGIGLSLIG